MTNYNPNWFGKNKFKNFLAIIDSKTFGHRNKIVNSSILTLRTWLIILKIIQLVKYLLKMLKCIKRNKKHRNNKI